MTYLADHAASIPVVAMWQQSEFGYLAPSVTMEQRVARLQQSLQKGALPVTLLAMSSDDNIVGVASILASTLTHKHLTPWLSAVFVPAQFRGKGIASALSLRAAEEARSMGFDQLYLFTPRNESLYARLGWQTIENARLDNTPVTIMSRATNLA
ncbi:N-acetyltransferase GCN5 [Undibacterium sp. KW1]|uniref:GNAT family N-acetyltransferase n=1 Tax=Undibacterium sp. KW1 TaxID=2058624 RepID=UPI001331FAAA|nr:GNAT family N-acetyltransferase [Undibacterium sp. KW1]BBB61986.1 N-acetyltransferase GCN5 [Undibacterium sp. KW1]